MSSVVQKKQLHDRNLSTIDQSAAATDDMIKTLSASQKMCPRALKNLKRCQKKKDESLRP